MFLGIEIGGTKLQLGIGPGDGTIVALERARVEPAGGAGGILEQIAELVPKLLAGAGLARAGLAAAGIGFGGPVDAEKGIVTKSHQIEGWSGFPLADWSRREFGWPTVVHNDADTAGLAEACFGAGRGYSPIFYITIGSGIGGGLIIDQKIYRGAGAGAGEIGHMRVPKAWDHLAGELFDSHGHIPRFPATVEEICSGWGMASRLRRKIGFYQRIRRGEKLPNQVSQADLDDAERLLQQVAGDPEQITAETIGRAVRAENRVAVQNLAATASVLGWAIAQMITLICPRRVVLGGGVTLMGEDLLFPWLRFEMSNYDFKPFAEHCELVPAALGEGVVVHGALRLARDMAQVTSQ